MCMCACVRARIGVCVCVQRVSEIVYVCVRAFVRIESVRGRMHSCVRTCVCVRARAHARACVNRISTHVHMMNTTMQSSDIHL
jgi:hypothetical protein